MTHAFRVGRIAGIDIYINWSWIIIVVFLTISLATGWFPSFYRGYSATTYIILGFIATLLLFVSVLLHELAHSVVARARGLSVNSIILFIFGGISNIEQEPQSPGVEFQMAFVGPLTSLIIGALCYAITFALRGSHSPINAIFSYLAVANILLGIFNLIPGFPLDGGRVFRSIVWAITGNAQTATRVATLVGQVIAYLFILAGILLFFTGNGLDGIWLAFIGWFLLSATHSARAQATIDSAFEGVTVGQVMNTAPITVPANISLEKLVYEYFLPRGLRSALVMQVDMLTGLITLSDIRHVPREQWGQTPVGMAMIPVDRLHVVSPQQSLRDALPLMNGQDVNQLPVVQDGQLVGVLTREAVMRSLEIRRSLNVRRVA